MQNNSRSQTLILIISAVVLVLAVLLFVNGLSIRDFPQPGQDLFSGRSGPRLAAAFALLAALATALLFMVVRSGRPSNEAAAPAAARMSAKAKERSRDEAPGDAPGGVMSDAAGELRTSVEVIQEELEEILEDEAPADKEHMQSLYEETDRLRKIIDSMEQLSQAQAIARALKKEPLEVEPLLRAIVEKTKLSVTDRDVAYHIECEAGLVVQGDAECLSRIIGNIADNAARSIKGSGVVTLAAGREAGVTVYSVADTGSGIRRAHLSHIYERFFRGTGTGIGMGLSIVKELVDACGGKIDAATVVGKGTTFTVRLPE